MSVPDFLADFRWRGQLQLATAADPLEAHLALARGTPGGRRAYVGFDPTADSLTVGNLVGIIALARWQRAGHTPVVLMGGGTGFIGDPSGKSAERALLSADQIRANVDSISGIFRRVIDFSEGLANRGQLLNNYDWLSTLGYIDALRDLGKHFSVNMMMQKDSVRERLTARDQGISYTEFSYMILQAYDFLHLYQHHGVTVQMGATDQWGNILCGIDLIRRKVDRAEREPDAFGICWPLVTKADGEKFGKSESGAVWLTPERTSPYAFYQFWLGAEDSKVIGYLKTYTFLDRERISELEAAHAADPGKREAHRQLARHMTELLHGPTEADNAQAAAAALFSGDISALPLATLREVFASAPSSTHDKSTLAGGVGLLDLLVFTKLAASKREAREFLSTGAVAVNGRKAGPDDSLTPRDLLHGQVIALRRGKKNWHLTIWA